MDLPGQVQAGPGKFKLNSLTTTLSGDDTDEENKPKRTIPVWAKSKRTLKESLLNQYSKPTITPKDIFAEYQQTADLDQLFGTTNKYTSRSSSAHWGEVPIKDGNLDFSILTEDDVQKANNIFLKYNKNE